MPQLLSEYFGIAAAEMDRLGVYDTFVDLDSQLHVDPHLLGGSSAPEMRDAEDTLRNYFEDLIILMEEATGQTDLLYEEATKKLILGELKGVSLGYSKDEGDGSAVGPGLAAVLASRAYRIVKGGEKNPRLFEIVGLFTDDFGPDRISDVVLRVADEAFATYTARVASELKLPTQSVRVGKGTYNLPTSTRKGKARPLYFVPQDVLAELPVALNRSEIRSAAKYNEQVRTAVNDLFASVGRDKYIRPTKFDLWERVLERPELVHALLEAYDVAPAEPYDFALDPAAESGRLRDARALAAKHPLQLPAPAAGWTGASALAAVKGICLHFKKLVESNGLWETLWVDPGVTPLKEKGIQRIFFGVAVTYCRDGQPDLDVSPEVNSGPGPVDFKFSHGAKIKVNVEMKKSNHARLLHGYQTQLERYNAAEGTDRSIYLIVRTGDDQANLDAVQNLRDRAIKDGRKSPEIIIVDARPQKSASKA